MSALKTLRPKPGTGCTHYSFLLPTPEHSLVIKEPCPSILRGCLASLCPVLVLMMLLLFPPATPRHIRFPLHVPCHTGASKWKDQIDGFLLLIIIVVQSSCFSGLLCFSFSCRQPSQTFPSTAGAANSPLQYNYYSPHRQTKFQFAFNNFIPAIALRQRFCA